MSGILTLADYAASTRSRLFGSKNSVVSGTLLNDFWSGSGFGATVGSLDPANTANGLVPDNTTAGALGMPVFSGRGYIARADVQVATNTGRFILYDRLFHAGGYTAAMGTVTLASQPDYSARVPGGTDFTGLQLWAECPGTSSGGLTVTVTYTDQSGNAGHTTGAQSFANPNSTVGFLMRMPLASGDCGIQKIETVTMGGANTGKTTIFIARPLWMFHPPQINTTYDFPMETLGMIEVFPTSSLCFYGQSDNVVFQIVFDFEIASK